MQVEEMFIWAKTKTKENPANFATPRISNSPLVAQPIKNAGFALVYQLGDTNY